MAVKFKRKKVFVGMSGGVDSSVAAWLLKKRGYDVTGVFIRGFNVDNCAEQDARDARRTAAKIGIPFYVFNFENDYKKKVVDYMIDGYKKGITPNPDVMCNREIKFGLFLKKALALGADYVATGHYVRLGRTVSRKQHNFFPAKKFASLSPRHPSLRSGTELAGLRDVPQNSPASPKFSLFAAKDVNKDQSYFLWTLTQKELRYCLFPIGDYLKSEVREIARKAGLPTAEKKDSQGICFLGQVKLVDFLKKYIKPKKGAIMTPDNKKIGEHQGIYFYTIGQRRIKAAGLKNKKSDSRPFYVAEKSVKTNALVVAEGGDNPVLFKKEIKLKGVNFINPSLEIRNSKLEIPVLARIRYRQPLASAALLKINNGWKMIFAKPQKFVAPGQSAVFYLPAVASAKAGSGLELLGGGVIE